MFLYHKGYGSVSSLKCVMSVHLGSYTIIFIDLSHNDAQIHTPVLEDRGTLYQPCTNTHLLYSDHPFIPGRKNELGMGDLKNNSHLYCTFVFRMWSAGPVGYRGKTIMWLY